MKIRNIIVCLLTMTGVLLALGCARTVTSIVNYGEQMRVEVALRGTVEAAANRYFLVLSASPAYKVPLPLPNIDYDAPEFIEPGLVPRIGTAEAYYTKYYATWSGYVVLEINQLFSAKGPFISGGPLTREALSNFSGGGAQINFDFRLGKIFGTVPDTIYFDVVAVPWPEAGARIPADHLTSTNAYISKVAGSISRVEDETDAGISSALDIISCRVEVVQ